jgi:hypothetical protein
MAKRLTHKTVAEERLRRVSKDGDGASWFETAQGRLLTMRKQIALAYAALQKSWLRRPTTFPAPDCFPAG